MRFRVKEDFFRKLLHAGDVARGMLSMVYKLCVFLFSLSSLVFFALFVYYIGFNIAESRMISIKNLFNTVLVILFVSRIFIGFYKSDYRKIFSFSIRAVILLFCLLVIMSNAGLVRTMSGFWELFRGTGLVITAGFLLSAIEIYRLFELITSLNFPPSFVFSVSFLFVILLGAGLLMLPKARALEISTLDVIFTSVSAVCVTGLAVVDIGTSFTIMGKTIILCLIQVGGLGMMTFTGFFSFIFTSRATLQERMLIKDLFSSETLNNLFKLLVKIVLFTFLIEGAGAIAIYMSLDESTDSKIFFSVFHSVSAFCNAGFSTLPEGLMAGNIRDNYMLLSSVTLLIIFGGLGFPVMLRIYAVIKRRIISVIDRLTDRKLYTRLERFDASSKIAITSSLFLIFAGTALLWFLEKDTTLQGLPEGEKIFVSYFNSVTARTAGFNMTNLSLLGYPAVFIVIVLMWIGASPGSTGGGIKTTSFAVALRMAWSIARGRNKLEIAGREINQGSISRVLAIIILSVITISAGFFGLLIFESDKEPLSLLFETVSAYSTVGLSIAGTPDFSQGGKLILILVMYTGRVGPLTLLTGLFLSSRRRLFSYPSGDILIN